jgi:uncharacterized OB-fold protein
VNQAPVGGSSIPRPAPGPDDAPFWEWCRRGQLRIQRCTACGEFRHRPRPLCPTCASTEAEWAPVSGRGVVWSYTVCFPPVLPAFEDRVPYNAVVVRLEEGPFLVSNLLDCPNDAIEVEMPVEAVLVTVDDELTLPLFRPAT